MMGELDFTEYSQHLGDGLFADKVLLALLRFQRTGTVGKEEKETFKRAKAFLADAIEGGKSHRRAFRSSQDVASTRAFTQAVAAITTPAPSKGEFINYLGELYTTVKKLLSNEQVTIEELNLLDVFFSRYAQVQFQRSESILESV